MKRDWVSKVIFPCNFNPPTLAKSTSTKDKCLQIPALLKLYFFNIAKFRVVFFSVREF